VLATALSWNGSGERKIQKRHPSQKMRKECGTRPRFPFLIARVLWGGWFYGAAKSTDSLRRDAIQNNEPVVVVRDHYIVGPVAVDIPNGNPVIVRGIRYRVKLLGR